MKSLDAIGADSLRWEQSGKLESRLSADGEVAATLKWAKSWGSLATAESSDGEWTLKRAGFLRPRVTLRKIGSDSDFAVLAMNWAGEGQIAFSDSEVLQFKRSGFWNPEFSMLDSNGTRLLLLKPDSGWKRKRKAAVEISNVAGSSRNKMALLAIIAWYVVLLISEYDYDGGGATAAVMAASGF